MDPDAALERMRRLTSQIVTIIEARAHYAATKGVEGLAWDMAELFQGLDDWITNKKGFLPRDWRGD